MNTSTTHIQADKATEVPNHVSPVKPLNVAMVGVGGYGAERRRLMRNTGLFKITRTYDINTNSMAQAEVEDGAKPATSYEDLLDTPGIEAMIISSGAKFHAEYMLAAMERGLNVFVEKPLCSTPAEIDALVAAQKASGVVVGVGHTDNTRHPYMQRMRQMIEAGELGSVVTFEKTAAHSGGLTIQPGEWRGDPEANPGGMLFQCGVHAIHDLLYLFGPITKVCCKMRYDVHSTQTADSAHCILTFASGLMGTLNAYHVTPYRHTFSIFGTAGALHKRDRFFDEGTTLQFQPRKLNDKEPEISLEIDATSDDCTGSLRSFYAAVRTGLPCYPSLADGALAVAVVFAAEESAITGREMAIVDRV
ncbi:MAG: Gfo/Idh/MocA family oxidoreductase [Pirellulales bacterium]|nr:Gfo/Idh/MocA family oxidoreductase [Pirellulales bacterium]